MHHEVRLGQSTMDLLDQVHLQHIPIGCLRELVRPVGRPDRNGERVDAGGGDELDGLVRIGQVHLAGAMSVFDPSESAELTFDRRASRVGVRDDLLGDGDVVLERGGRLSVGLEGAVHHHAREAEIDCREARLGLVAVVEVQRNGNLRVQLDRSLHEMPEKEIVRVRPGAA